MVAKTLTISVPQEDFEYLANDALLSPSKIFQVALNNIKENRKSFDEELKRKSKLLGVLQRRLTIATEILQLNNLIEEYDKKCEVKE